MRTIVLIAHNLRSCHNVGSLLRTADGLGLHQVYLTGYTPYPQAPNDTRMPHEVMKISKQIRKTALGAEQTVDWQHDNDLFKVLERLRKDGYTIAALEQTTSAQTLQNFVPPDKIALIAGREVEGIETDVLARCDVHLEIPMHGQKESFNVTIAAGIALYTLSVA